MSSRDLSQQSGSPLDGDSTVPVCTHETSVQDLNLPCQACLLAERDRLRELGQRLADLEAVRGSQPWRDWLNHHREAAPDA